MFKYLLNKSREYIFIILFAIILLLVSFSKSFSEDNIFVVDKVEVNGTIDLNFSREKYINKAFLESFRLLTSKILVSRDLDKVSNIKLKKIKSLINSFQIIDEIYISNEYKLILRISYSDDKIKKFLRQKNISFSQTKKISAIFFPILIINDEIKNFDENFFYRNWNSVQIENESINFILPIDELDDSFKIREMKNRIEDIEISSLVNKYDIKNYTFAIIDYNNENLKIHIKTKFEENKMSKNIFYKISNINDKKELNLILIDLKMQITDLWKEANVVNLLLPLSIKIKLENKNLLNLDKLKNALSSISIVDSYFYLILIVLLTIIFLKGQNNLINGIIFSTTGLLIVFYSWKNLQNNILFSKKDLQDFFQGDSGL